MMPVVLITPIRWSRSPIQTFFLFLLFVTGIAILTELSQSPIVEKVGDPWSKIWGGSITLGSAIALFGAYWKNQITGMIIERSGIYLLGIAAVFWCGAVYSEVKLDGLYTEVMTLIFAAVCAFQVRYINKHVDMILHAIDNGGHVRE